MTVQAAGKKFGFGCMRLPVTEKGNPTSFDFPLIEKMFDSFLEKGFTYFDTAYVYHAYEAEKAVRRALVERHERSSFQLATKLPLRDFKDAEDMENIFNEQLINCGVSYFDYYLLHNMGHIVYDKCRKYDAFGFVRRKKEEGKILNAGMSFHDTPELLEDILHEYSECLDFIQLQINYVDMEQPNVQGRRCLDTAVKYNKPVIVMEPCKGGTLAKVPEAAERLMKGYSPDSSAASWAFRYAAMQQGVFMVLSGMNSLEQVEDNCLIFSDLKPLSHDELDVIESVKNIITANTPIPCTSCEYCMPDCPQNIAISKYFSAYNSIMQTTGDFSSQNIYYINLHKSGFGKPSDCLKCGLCEQSCPQHLTIRDYLEKVDEKFSSLNFMPSRPEK